MLARLAEVKSQLLQALAEGIFGSHCGLVRVEAGLQWLDDADGETVRIATVCCPAGTSGIQRRLAAFGLTTVSRRLIPLLCLACCLLLLDLHLH